MVTPGLLRAGFRASLAPRGGGGGGAKRGGGGGGGVGGGGGDAPSSSSGGIFELVERACARRNRELSYVASLSSR
jgi:hypothetical protein